MQPPQNPYNDPQQPSPQQPLPQPAPSMGRPGSVSTEAIGEAWAALKPNLATWIGAALIYIVVLLIVSALQNVIAPRDARGLPQFNAVSLVTQLLVSVVSILLGAGLFKLAIQQLRTGRVEIGEMFNVFDVIGALIVGAILTGLITLVGFALLVIPGLIAILLLSMVNPLIVDQKLSGVEAVQRSFEVTKDHLGGLLVLGIVLFLINMLGACACGLGMLVTLPLTYLTFAIVYRDLFLGGSISGTPTVPNFPTPPIADPRS